MLGWWREERWKHGGADAEEVRRSVGPAVLEAFRKEPAQLCVTPGGTGERIREHRIGGRAFGNKWR